MHGAKIVKIRILYRIDERVSWIGLLDMTEICKILFFVSEILASSSDLSWLIRNH